MLYRFLRKRISEFKLKEAKSSPHQRVRILLRKTRRIKMRINGFSGTNTQTGTMGMSQGNEEDRLEFRNAQSISAANLMRIMRRHCCVIMQNGFLKVNIWRTRRIWKIRWRIMTKLKSIYDRFLSLLWVRLQLFS